MCIGVLPTCMYMHLVCAMPVGPEEGVGASRTEVSSHVGAGSRTQAVCKSHSALKQGASCPSLFVLSWYFFYYEGLPSCLTMGLRTLHMLGKHCPVELYSQISSCR